MLSPSPTPTAHGGRLVTPDGRALPLAQVHLAVEAGGGIARTVLTQRFENPYDEPLEVRYLLPLPADGAVSGFAFLLGERRVVGEVTDRRAARERFERALATGRTAALLEQDRSSLFTQQVGNLPPRTAVTAEVTVDQPLRWLEEGAWEWRFPTVVTPRYQGALGRVQDALKLSVPVRADAPLEVRASLALAVADRLTGAVASPSHGLRVREGDPGAEVELERSARLDRDLVITWPVALPDVSASVLAARPATAAHDGDTFALLTVAPPTGGGVALPRDLTVLIDTSGSMSGQPLSQAKRVVSALIETLGIEDRLELIEFSSAPTRWKPEPTVASETHKRDALRWVKTLRAGGCTEMHEAVLEALRPLRADSQRQVVLVTDGAIGFEQEIVRAVLEDLPGQARVHTVGVGSGINRTLTRGAARAGRGVELLLGAHENPDAAVGRLIARTAAPLVTELRLEGAEVLGVAPRGLPDLYAESPALIAVRCRAGAREVVLRGRTAEGDFEARLALPALARGEGPAGVVALYARELVEDLEASLSGGGQARELNPAIEATGVAFQIATRLTSWVAVSELPTVDPRAQRRQVEQPHELPHGTSAEGLGLREGRSAQGEDDPFRLVGMEHLQDLNLPKTNDLPWPRATEASSILDAPEELSADEELGVPPLDAQLLEPAADEPLVTEAFELMQESGEEDVDVEVVVFDTGRRVEVPFPRSLTMNAASPVMNPEQAEALRAVREGRATFGGPSRAKPKRWRRRLLLLAALAALAALVGWVIWSSAGVPPR
ncbi:MAG: VIT domain-containing protein [Planctomycetota bacterium]